MSIHSGKKAIFVGNPIPLTETLRQDFSAEGMSVVVATYEEANIQYLKDEEPNIVVLNGVADKAASTNILNILRTSNLIRNIAVFVMTKDTQDDIQAALTLGAADFFTDTEKLSSIKLKVNNLLGESNNFAGSKIVDISEDEPHLDAKGVRVYVVEDDPLLKNLLALKLEQSKFPALISRDGLNVVTEMKEFKPQVVVLDLMLPGKNGFEILEEIKGVEELANIPVIIFSNRDEQSDRNKAKELGANGFYVKALTDLSELIEVIDGLA